MNKKDDVCEWKIMDIWYQYGCVETSDGKTYVFCPYCGKWIKTEVEK